MFKEFFMKKAVEKQMAGVPKDQQEKMMELVTKNPELFQKMAVEVKAEMDKGKDQMAAVMEVGKKYQDELKKLM
ncbi:hypothetical protein CL654_02205 [bacterium]|nr:hypothetical protein [bacterium]|tara:strand:- start:5736 stop:5957 length:222 start_codon:yes stop_codon:yes gene_type:complete